MSHDEDSDPIYTTYCALWAKAKAQGAVVLYESWMPAGVSGTFYPHNEDDPYRKPTIAIHRPSPETYIKPSRGRLDGVEPDLRTELFTLAHEYGHFVSYKAGGRTPAYVEAVKHLERRRGITPSKEGGPEGPLAEEERELMRREERLAWGYGREALVELGFEDVAGYDAHTQKRLGVYEEVFELDAAGAGPPTHSTQRPEVSA